MVCDDDPSAFDPIVEFNLDGKVMSWTRYLVFPSGDKISKFTLCTVTMFLLRAADIALGMILSNRVFERANGEVRVMVLFPDSVVVSVPLLR